MLEARGMAHATAVELIDIGNCTCRRRESICRGTEYYGLTKQGFVFVWPDYKKESCEWKSDGTEKSSCAE